MSYHKITIKEVLKEIDGGRLFLPAIQRKFVWKEEQTTKLFDSLMREYPIGTFLFWDIDTETDDIKGYTFYDFIRNFDVRNELNEKRENFVEKKFKVALDGQQRLTSLYIGIMGSWTIKEPRKRWNNPDAFIRTELFLNTSSNFSNGEEDDVQFEFLFLDPKNMPKNNNNYFKVSKVLNYNNTMALLMDVQKENKYSENEMELIGRLWDVICKNEIINYYLVKESNMDKVLDIFVRVNSGGTVLSKSDLIFSTLTANWLEARDLIDSLIKNINRSNKKFSFNNDFIMRTMLYVTDLPIQLKVDSFKANVPKIKDNFPKIEDAIKTMVLLIEESGFSNQNITSYNALIPIVYFIYKGGDYKGSKKELIKYFIVAQVKNLFGVASNSALTETRKALTSKANNYELNNKQFELKQFNDIVLTGDRNFIFDEEEIEKLFDELKGQYTFMILSLLYPEIKIDQVEFHQDHMHPVFEFNPDNLKEKGLSDNDIKDFQIMKDQLPNLQLLKGLENKSKSKTPLKEWLAQGNERDKYLPKDISTELKDFRTFYNERKKVMKTKLIDILEVSINEEKIDEIIEGNSDIKNELLNTTFYLERTSITNEKYEGKMIIKGPKKYVLLKGAKVNPKTKEYAQEQNKQLKEDYQDSIDNNNQTTKDISFESPSAAAVFVIGYNENGWEEWKSKEGKQLKDFIERGKHHE